MTTATRSMLHTIVLLAAGLWFSDAAEAQTPILYLTPQNELVMIPGYGTLGMSATALASDDQGKTWHTWDAFSTWPAMAYADVVHRGNDLLAFGFNSNNGYAGGTYLWQSSNNGLTWTGGNALATPDSWAPMNQRVLLTSSGRLIVPVDQIVSGGEGSGPVNVGTIYSDNGGQSWTRSPIFGPPPGYPTAPEGIGEPAVVELANGKDWMVARGLGGHLLQSFSDNDGATWDTPTATTLVSPLSAVNAKRIPHTNDVICIWDNAHPGTSTVFGDGSSLWDPRYPLVYAISKNNCQTWSQPVVIDPDWAAYPSITFSDTQMFVAYVTNNFTSVAVVSYDIQTLIAPEPSALVLLAAGLLGMLGYAWRRRACSTR